MTERDGRQKKKIGRPVEPVPEDVAERLFEWMESGRTVTSFAAMDGNPKVTTIWQWCRKDESFRERFALARIAQGMSCVELAQDVANDASNDWTVGKDGEPKLNSEHVQRSKLRVDTYMKRAACFAPQMFGTRIQMGGDPDAPPIKVEATHPAPELPRGDDLKKYLAEFFAAASAQGMIATDAASSQNTP